jgi:hypothetical protein
MNEISSGIVDDAADVDSFTNVRERSPDLSIGAGDAGNGMAASAAVAAHNERGARCIALR